MTTVQCACGEFEFDASARLLIAAHPGEAGTYIVHGPRGCEVLVPGKMELQLLWHATRRDETGQPARDAD